MNNEWGDLMNYIMKSDFQQQVCRQQLMALWTAFCIHNDLDVDTSKYDELLSHIYIALLTKENLFDDWKIFSNFENYICKFLV